MIKLARLLAGVAIFGFFVWSAGWAADAEFASAGGVLSEREKGCESTCWPRSQGEIAGQIATGPRATPMDGEAPRSESTIHGLGSGDTFRQEEDAVDSVLSGSPVFVQRGRRTTEVTYQGKPIRWWARRAVQARKDANARGLTIRRLQSAARHQLAYPTGHWLDSAFLCIHRYERGAAGWATNTGNGYRGGLQFDSSFARTYGPAWAFRAFGNVERWPASVQIAAAIQAWTSRSFGPWPNTRIRCGL